RRRASTRSSSPGSAASRRASRTTTACRARPSSSNTRTRRTGRTTSTRSGGISTATSAATCCASTIRPITGRSERSGRSAMSEKIQDANEEDLRRLGRLLRQVAGRDLDAVKRRLEGKAAAAPEARVLDLACGDCREAEVLSDFAAELKGGEAGSAKLTGLDVR